MIHDFALFGCWVWVAEFYEVDKRFGTMGCRGSQASEPACQSPSGGFICSDTHNGHIVGAYLSGNAKRVRGWFGRSEPLIAQEDHRLKEPSRALPSGLRIDPGVLLPLTPLLVVAHRVW
jgi:hypothetical protein